MAKAGGLRPRALAELLGGYVLLLIVIAYFLSDRLAAGWYDAGMVRWYGAAFVVLGALALVGVCVGAVARARTLEARMAELEDAQLEALVGALHAGSAASAPLQAYERAAPVAEPTDQDVDQLLVELQRAGEAAAAEMGPGAGR